jgi:hypothetical protein
MLFTQHGKVLQHFLKCEPRPPPGGCNLFPGASEEWADNIDVKFILIKGHMELQTYNFVKNTTLMSLMFSGNQFLTFLFP